MSCIPQAARTATFSLLTCLLIAASPAAAQTGDAPAQPIGEGFLTGKAAQAWDTWQTALNAILDDDLDAANAAFGELLAAEVSPLRLALLEQRSILRGAGGGALLLLEQDAGTDNLPDNARQILDLLEIGREQLNLADDGWYFASIGRFAVANANFQALLQQDPDPVALLEFTDSVPERHKILVQLAGNPIIGDNVRDLLAILREGERIVRADPIRIRYNISRLAGNPRAKENATEFLVDSGEYAVPALVESLRDPQADDLTQEIVRVLPLIDRPALNPLLAALQMQDDDATKVILIEAVAKIGYPQTVPYLLALRESPTASDEVHQASTEALRRLELRGVTVPTDLAVADAFFHLAELHYDQAEMVAADTRLETANVWYWRDGILINVPVPTEIFDEVMAMRLSRRALDQDVEHAQSLALWLAANFRRAAQLGDRTDDTRPENFPSPAYFAQSAGSQYNQLALARGVKDGDPAVALGTIAALRQTAGAASLIGSPQRQQPLAEALAFPNRLVRVRAALALAAAQPTDPFKNYQNLIPVLAETLNLYTGVRTALVVDPDQALANEIAAALRAEGYQIISDTNLLSGLREARDEMPGLDAIFVGSDIGDPGLRAGLDTLREDFQFAATPVIIVAKEADVPTVEDLVAATDGVGQISPDAPSGTIIGVLNDVAASLGAAPIDAQLGRELTAEAVELLRRLAISENELFQPVQVQPALLRLLTQADADLRIATGVVLSHVDTDDAQQALAAIALDADEEQFMRIAMFNALAESAKPHGNRLTEQQVDQLVTLVNAADQPMELREAASQALGALSLPGHPAARIILQEAPAP